MDLIGSLARFSANLLAAKQEEEQNVIMSPVSIHQALNLVLLAAERDSQTERDLIDALGYSLRPVNNYHQAYSELLPSTKTEDLTMDVWTMLVAKTDLPFQRQYLDDTRKYYNSSVVSISRKNKQNRETLVNKVNKWGKEAGFENELMSLSDLDRDFEVMLMSAVQLQSHWFGTFNEVEDKNVFYNYGLNEQLVKRGKVLFKRDQTSSFVEFTSQQRAKYKQHHADVSSKHPNTFDELMQLDFRAIEVPMSGEVSITIFEPLITRKDSLAKLKIGLLSLGSGPTTRLTKALEVLDGSFDEVSLISFPAFKFESDYDLKGTLERMGLKRMFDRDTAEVSRLLVDKRAYVSAVRHQAIVEVNKHGLKAAALTRIELQIQSLQYTPDPIEVRIKSPFLFLIRYNQVPLFIGQVVKI